MPHDTPLLRLDRNTHSLVAIRRALHDFAATAPMDVASDGSRYAIFSLTESQTPEHFCKELLDCIIEHEIRLDLEKKYGAIRQIIVEQAIRPVDDDALAEKISASLADSEP
ncbi:hypothetical protein KL86DPRO_60199 [uncultured delta proteobacterium]|uniref:His-Xaa-Ser system protein HxsD n=1 Tax=uncultured delta proteobacterium TaxID=34034 RepID=A0A212KFP5_9DELT|nr:hypothetical protein KL86DPRO_60199 [uncultured delta proteobacterium]